MISRVEGIIDTITSMIIITTITIDEIAVCLRWMTIRVDWRCKLAMVRSKTTDSKLMLQSQGPARVALSLHLLRFSSLLVSVLTYAIASIDCRRQCIPQLIAHAASCPTDTSSEKEFEDNVHTEAGSDLRSVAKREEILSVSTLTLEARWSLRVEYSLLK